VADELASLQIMIQASLKDFSQKMGDFESILKGTEDATKDAKTSFGELTLAMAAGQLAADAARVAFQTLKSAVMEGVNAADSDIVLMIRLKSALGDGAEAIEQYAIKQETLTRFRKNDTLSAANSLVIHNLTRKEIEKLLPVIEDFAEKKGVTATETAEAFGRAIEYGATRGLRTFGIEVDKSGSQLEIFNQLVAAGDGNVKRMAEKMGQAGLGPMVIFNNQVKEIEKEFGKKLLPEITDFVRDIGPGLLLIFGKLAEAGDLLVKFWGQVGTTIGNLVWHGESISASLEEVRVQRTIEKYKIEKDTNALFDLRAETLKKIDDLQMRPHFDKKEMSALESEAKAYAKAIADINAAAKTEGVPGAPEKSKLGTTPLSGEEEKDDFWEKQHALILSNLDVYKTKAETAVRELNDALKNSQISLKEWYDQSLAEIEKTGEEEIAVQKEIIRTTNDAMEKEKANNALKKITEQIDQKRNELSEKYAAALKKEEEAKEHVQNIIAEAEGQALPQTQNLQDQFTREEALRKAAQAKKIIEVTALKHTEEDLDKLKNAHERENAEKTFEFKKALKERELELASQSAGQVAEIANGLYELTGNKSIAMFNLGKAASVAQAEINAFQGATKSIAQGGFWGIALGVLTELAAQVYVAKIIATPPPKKAEGGLLVGPSHANGGMLYNTEGGEYVHQRSAVQTYGTQAMDAINRGLIPPAALHAYSGSSTSSTPAKGAGGKGGQVTVHITNLQDPRMIDQHLASAEGRTSHINFMGQNKMAIRKALGI
jgi:hypothetical protein